MNYVPFPALTDSPQTILTATTLLDVQNLLQSPTPSGSNFSVYASGIESGLINVGTGIIRGLPNSMLTNGEFMLGDLTGIPYFTNQAVNNTLNGLVNMGQNLSALYQQTKSSDPFTSTQAWTEIAAVPVLGAVSALALRSFGLFNSLAVADAGVGGEVSSVTSLNVENISTSANLMPQSMDNMEVRQWYLDQLSQIPGQIDPTLPLQQQALQAFVMRNALKLAARDLMSDQDTLNALPPPSTLQDIVSVAYNRNLVGDNLWNYIYESSTRSNQTVNESLGLQNSYTPIRNQP